MFVSVKHCGGEVMIAGFDFLSLTNFWGGFLKESFTPAFVDQVCSAAENVNVALMVSYYRGELVLV